MQGDPDTSYRKLLKTSVEAETERRKIQNQLIQTKKLKDKQEKVVAKATRRLEQLKKEIKQIPSHIKKEEERKRHRKPMITAAGPFQGRRRPLQCWQCGNWGHTSLECVPERNKEIDKKEEKKRSSERTQKKRACPEQGVEKEDKETEESPPKRVHKTQKEKLKEFKKGVAKCIQQTKLNYYNPDPMV